MATNSPEAPAGEPVILGSGDPAKARQRWLILGAVVVGVLALGAIIFGGGSGQTWQSIGSASQHPLTMLVSDANQNIIFAGTEEGQVLASSDGGQTWRAQQAGLPGGIVVSALAQTPDGARLFAGTSQGVFVSSDNGLSWVNAGLKLPADETVDALAVAPNNAAVILAGTTHDGVFRSQDGGQTWGAASPGLPNGADVYGFAFAPDGQNAYAGLIDGGGVGVSHDGGQTWTVSGAGLPTEKKIFTLMPLVDSAGKVIDVLAGTSAGLFQSKDGGQTWTAEALAGLRVISLTPDPQSGTLLAAGTDNGVYDSGNAGATWQYIGVGWPAHQAAGSVAISHPAGGATVIYAAADRGYRFPGENFSAFIGGIRILGIVLLVGLLILLSARQSRIMRSLMPANTPLPGQVNGVFRAVGSDDPARQLAARAHIRGGPKLLAPTIFPERGGAMTITTRRGPVPAIFAPVLGARQAVILLPGADGDVGGPAGFFAPLAERLQLEQVLGLRLGARQPGNRDAALDDALGAIDVLQRHGVEQIVLIGWDQGATVALDAALERETVAGVIMLAPTDDADAPLSQLAPRPLLIIHGVEDRAVPSHVAQNFFARAAEPKELSLLPNAGHDLAGYRDALVRQIAGWCRASGFARRG